MGDYGREPPDGALDTLTSPAGVVSPPRQSSAIWCRRAFLIVCPLLFAGLLIWHRSTVETGADSLPQADIEWLVLAAATAAATWVAGSCCQLGATTAYVPITRVFAVQVAGSFLNHVLPAGAGGVTLNMRMFRRAGLTRSDAASAVSLNAAVGMLVHVLALGALLALNPSVGHVRRGTVLAVVAVGAPAAAGIGILIWQLSGRFVKWRAAVRDACVQTRVVLRRPFRAVLLWAGSAAVPALHIVTLLAVVHALHLPTPTMLIASAYLGASALAALVPTPGGMGGLDVALIAALVGVGLAAGPAVAAVIIYRLLTVWIPLLPGVVTFVILLHRRII